MSFQSSTSSGSGGWTKPPAVADSLGKRGEFAQNTDSSARVREATSGAEVTSAFRGSSLNPTSTCNSRSGSSSNRWARTATDSDSMGTATELVLRSRPSGKWDEVSNEQQQCYGKFVPCRPSPTHGAEMIGSEVHGRRRGQTEIKGATLPCIRMRELKRQEKIILVRRGHNALKEKCEGVDLTLGKCQLELEKVEKDAYQSLEKLSYHRQQIKECMLKKKDGQKVEEKVLLQKVQNN
eukprot:Em0002g1354a